MSLFKTLKKIIGGAAPILGTVVGGPFGAAAGGLIANALGVDNDEQAMVNALQADPGLMAKIKQIEAENIGELNKLYMQTIAIEVQEHHKTYRTELISQDAFVRRWRPGFGWACVLCFIMQFLLILVGGLYAIFVVPERSGQIFTGISEVVSSLVVIWTIAFSVLGINITSRSKDKQLAAGQAPNPGIVQSIMSKVLR
jgi:hypothetical protein